MKIFRLTPTYPLSLVLSFSVELNINLLFDQNMESFSGK